MSTDPAPSAEVAAVRAAMTQLARLWEASADNLEHAIDTGASRHPSEVETLRGCAYELRSTLRARRPGAQSAGTGPAPDVDPLGHVRTGDLNPAQPGLCDGTTRTPDGKLWICTRAPHPPRWQHIASGVGRVRAVWTDEPQPDADS